MHEGCNLVCGCEAPEERTGTNSFEKLLLDHRRPAVEPVTKASLPVSCKSMVPLQTRSTWWTQGSRSSRAATKSKITPHRALWSAAACLARCGFDADGNVPSPLKRKQACALQRRATKSCKKNTNSQRSTTEVTEKPSRNPKASPQRRRGRRERSGK